MSCTCLAVLLLALLSPSTPLYLVFANMLLLGLGFGLFSSPNTNAVMGSVQPRFYGVAAGMLGTMRTVGMVFSMGLAMMIFAVVMGKTQITPEVYPLFMRSTKIAFSIFGILCLLGVFASLARGQVQRAIPAPGGPPPGGSGRPT